MSDKSKLDLDCIYNEIANEMNEEGLFDLECDNEDVLCVGVEHIVDNAASDMEDVFEDGETESDSDSEIESGSWEEDMDNLDGEIEMENSTGSVLNSIKMLSIFPNLSMSKKYNDLINSVAILLLMISNGHAADHIDSLFKILLALRIVTETFSVRQMKRKLKTCLWPSVPFFDIKYHCGVCLKVQKQDIKCCNTSCLKVAYCSLTYQIELLLHTQLDDILSYRGILRGEDNGDVLWGNDSILSVDPIILHLHISSDGGSLYRYKKISFWPFHAVLLDLPLYLRNKLENILIFGIWASRTKPDWEGFLFEYLKAFPFNEVITINLGTQVVCVILKLHTGVFDLPAQSSILNKTQFNGKFGCLFCNTPGKQIKVGHGSARKYPELGEIYLDDEYLKLATISSSTKVTVFGFKGLSVLQDYMNIPSHIMIDSLHTLYENCTKTLLSFYLDSKHWQSEFYLGRNVDFLNKLLQNVKVPSGLSIPDNITDKSFWRASDYKFFLLYLMVPIIGLRLKAKKDTEYAFHLYCFVIYARLLNVKSARSNANDAEILINFFLKDYLFYMVSRSVPLIFIC